MERAGIIVDLDYSKHISFKNYYYAIENIYGGVRLVKTIDALDGIDILFIGDDHYGKHRAIFMQDGFPERCNDKGVKVVVFTTERTFGTVYPWNEGNYYEMRSKFNNLWQYMTDVDDCIKTGAKLNRTLPSIHFKNPVEDVEKKIDKIVFIGTTEGYNDCYKDRRRLLAGIVGSRTIDIITTPIPLWEDYMKKLSEYRFVLAPKGNCNAFSLRFYDALMVHSIPLQQVELNTLKYFDIEGGFDDCIFFETIEEMEDKVKSCNLVRSSSEFWMEDYIKKLLTEDGLL